MIIQVAVLLFALFLSGQEPDFFDPLAVAVDGKSGQLEIGGPYAGAAFHYGRPLPSRISFFYPVANSLDLSVDYWKRDASQPLQTTLVVGQDTSRLEDISCNYRYVPHGAVFDVPAGPLHLSVAYRFGDDLQGVALTYQFHNRGRQATAFSLETDLALVLRTCQTYATKLPTRIHMDEKTNTTVIADFLVRETDSTALFVVQAGWMPHQTLIEAPADVSLFPQLKLRYGGSLQPGDSLSITQLIGTCRWDETEKVVLSARENWRRDVINNAGRIRKSVLNGIFRVPDSSLGQTLEWSRAVLAANQHNLDGRIVPMPCPAEYNFFFTHDLLLTDLGAVMTDSTRVRRDLLYLHSLTGADSILPHAYYWRDSLYQTEYCGSDNWNHLWFILLGGAYLRHSNDLATLRRLFPIIKKSLAMMLQNRGPDNLMYAYRPDWWDIGHIYGARVYITALTIRALREYAAIASKLGEDETRLAGFLAQSDEIQQAMLDMLWDEKHGYLMNMHDLSIGDPHYYAGSLIAVVYDLLNSDQKRVMMETARRELLDKQIGVRIAMPADFHTQIEKYHFNGMEAGEPYVYLNGGVWPHGNAWYALGWLMSGEPDSAIEVLARYHTLAGIAQSPDGQPSFYEYRRADPDSPRYGEIDKPTFLWAAGWYINVLYQLAGVRETPWHVALSPDLPSAWSDIDYDLLLSGGICRISYRGNGTYFADLRIDGQEAYSAVMYKPATQVVLTRGTPQHPYLAAAAGIVKAVRYEQEESVLYIELAGIKDTDVVLTIISPEKPASCMELASHRTLPMTILQEDKIYKIDIRLAMEGVHASVQVNF